MGKTISGKSRKRKTVRGQREEKVLLSTYLKGRSGKNGIALSDWPEGTDRWRATAERGGDGDN